MKKLFSFLCLLMLGAGMMVQAQLRDAVNDSIGLEKNPFKANFISERNNAPMETLEYTYSYSNRNVDDPTYDNDGDLYLYRLKWSRAGWGYPAVEVQLMYPKGGEYDYGSVTGPPIGTYTIYNGVDYLAAYDALGNTGYSSLKSCYWESNNSYFTFRSGTIEFRQGANGEPYVIINTSQGSSYNRYFSITIGEEIPEDGTIRVVPGNHGQIKVGSGDWQSTAFEDDYTAGTSFTIAANADDGYSFLKWDDENTQNPRTISVNGDATYTAIFDQNKTIQVVPGDHGQIKVGSGDWQSTAFEGEYATGASVTISAQADDGYYFSKWDDENTQNPRTISVTGDHTYTAVFDKNKTIVRAFDWANLAEGGTDAEWGSGDGLYIYRLYFTSGGINYPSLDLQLIYNKSKLQDYGSFTAPREGEYSLLNSTSATFYEFYALGGTGNSSYMSRYWDSNNSYKPFRTGTITISQGANGYPYIVVNTGQGNDTHQFFELTVGSPAVTTYSVTFKNDDGTQIGDVQNLEEGKTPTAPTEPTKDATTEYTYSFAGWKSSLNDNVYASNALPAVGTEAVIYTATYTSQAKAFMLKDGYTEDDKDNGNDDNFYNRLASMAGQHIESITYERTFKPKTWSVFALPFNYVLAASGHDFEGDVYGLTSVEYDAANNYLSLFFFPETTILYANRPYLYYSSTGVANPVFQNVTMSELKTNYYSVNNSGTDGGNVSFRNTMYRQRLNNDSHIVFINNNTLYYMGTNNVYMRAFRGYFYMDGFNINTGVAPRVRIVLNGQTATELEMVNDMPAAENGVRKYIENGVMVIEREGVKYNATGSKIK